MRRRRISSGRWTAGAVALAWAVAARGAGAAERTASVEAVRADVRFLSAPELGGRGALTAGLDDAARFIAARFAALGLSPAGEGGTFFQTVEIPLPQRPSPETHLAIGDGALELGVDFSPNAGTAATRASGPLIFIGYGFQLPGVRDDFAGLDLRGKVVLCLRPRIGERRLALPDRRVLVDSVPIARLLEEAVARGAVGVLFVDAQSAPDDPAAIEPLPAFAVEEVSEIASFHVRATAIDRLLSPSHTTVAALASESAAGASPRLAPAIWATFAVVWAPPRAKGRNVLGLLPGADPVLAREAVVVGAHYDHLGFGDEGGSLDGRRLHPGADDNASGTAAMLATAATLAGATPRPRRSILFVAFTGEEKGWAGSRLVAARAPRTVVAMLNLDMVGRMRGKALEVNGSATSPEWRAIVEAANLATTDRLNLSTPRGVPSGSDHQPFIMKEVPALFFFTGMHCDYHRGSDTWDKINAEGVVEVTQLVSGVARLVADRARRLTFESPPWAERRPPAGCAP